MPGTSAGAAEALLLLLGHAGCGRCSSSRPVFWSVAHVRRDPADHAVDLGRDALVEGREAQDRRLADAHVVDVLGLDLRPRPRAGRPPARSAWPARSGVTRPPIVWTVSWWTVPSWGARRSTRFSWSSAATRFSTYSDQLARGSRPGPCRPRCACRCRSAGSAARSRRSCPCAEAVRRHELAALALEPGGVAFERGDARDRDEVLGVELAHALELAVPIRAISRSLAAACSVRPSISWRSCGRARAAAPSGPRARPRGR